MGGGLLGLGRGNPDARRALDGHAWSIVPSVDPSDSDNELSGVSALAADDVWAVGYANTPSYDRTLVEHWNGHAWSVVDSPNPGGQAALAAVSFDSPTNGWAVGSQGTGTVKTLALHWDGHTWSVVTTPNLSNDEDQLLGVDALAPEGAYAVGYHDNGTGHQTLVAALERHGLVRRVADTDTREPARGAEHPPREHPS